MKNFSWELILIILILFPSLSLSIDPWNEYDIYILSVQWGSTMCLTQGQDCYEKMKKVPRHQMTIHGLWPSLSTGKNLDYCNPGADIPIEDSGSENFENMKKYWPSLNKNPNEVFWEHEFNKHGYCYLKKYNYDGNKYEIYFKKVLDLFFNFKINNLMINIAGDADDGEYVLPDDFVDKMDAKFGQNTYSLRCTKNGGDYYLSEIRIKFDLDFQLTTKGKSQNSCPNGKPIHVIYVS